MSCPSKVLILTTLSVSVVLPIPSKHMHGANKGPRPRSKVSLIYPLLCVKSGKYLVYIYVLKYDFSEIVDTQ